MGLIFEKFSKVGGATAPPSPRLVCLCSQGHCSIKYFVQIQYLNMRYNSKRGLRYRRDESGMKGPWGPLKNFQCQSTSPRSSFWVLSRTNLSHTRNMRLQLQYLLRKIGFFAFGECLQFPSQSRCTWKVNLH